MLESCWFELAFFEEAYKTREPGFLIARKIFHVSLTSSDDLALKTTTLRENCEIPLRTNHRKMSLGPDVFSLSLCDKWIFFLSSFFLRDVGEYTSVEFLLLFLLSNFSKNCQSLSSEEFMIFMGLIWKQNIPQSNSFS